jgi:ABC-type polysaccharide/polyol phosphate transport system ATPase subunit
VSSARASPNDNRNATASTTAVERPPAPDADSPLAIEVRDLHKSFAIPTQRVDSLKERAVHPFASRERRLLRALDGVSFEVRRGEFFGIVGRNGSGKSTLLKILSSIYRADSGTIRMAGRLAPFIELGVGFNHELTARENVVLNGVMMGLTPREMRRRLDSVIEFAELDEFADLKLKNYSSGMLVRLAFSVMLEANADVLLIDEVLAVGDASFQQKCADAFHRMKGEGKTIVLVTHEMGAVETYCHRAMLLADGNIQFIGDPAEAGREYLKLNFEGGVASAGGEEEETDGARLLDCWLENEGGERLTALEQGEPINLHVELELLREVSALTIGFLVVNADGVGMFELGVAVFPEGDATSLPVQKLIRVDAKAENVLAPGRHFIHCGVQSAQDGGVSIYAHNAISFVTFGSALRRGVIAPEHEIVASVDGKRQP